MKKRLLSILLTACLLVGLLPTVAFAAGNTVTASESMGKYATNPIGTGRRATITIDGSYSDWSENMLIAQGAAWDVANRYKGAHESSLTDCYSLYAAWDDDNLYIGWQMVNTTDTWSREGDGPLSNGGRIGDVPMMLALSIDPDSTGMTGRLTDGGKIWDSLDITFTTHADVLLLMSGEVGQGTPALFKAADAQGNTSYKPPYCMPFYNNGIQYAMEEGCLPSTLWMIDGIATTPAEEIYQDTANYVDALTFVAEDGKTHNTTYDSFYEIKIPYTALGIDANYLEANGIGVMLIATRGESAIDCLPHDPSMLDNAMGDYASDPSTSHEKDDNDNITVPFAVVGGGEVNTDIASITSVEITGIDTPIANTALDTEAACATTGVSSTKPQVTWTSRAAAAGYDISYTASVTLTAVTGYEFKNSTTATVNGNAATSVTKNLDGTLTVTYDFTVIPAVSIDYVAETLSTDTTMEYTVGNGSWTACTENMAATAFGWTGSAEVEVQFRTKATDISYASEPVTVTIPARPECDLSIDSSDECVTIPDGYRYNTTSADDSETWTDGSGSAVTVAPDSNIYIYKAATASAFKSEVQTLTAPGRSSITDPTIDYTAETLSTDTTMEYTVGNGSWTTCTENMAATAFGWTGAALEVQFRTAATANKYASNLITVEILARPDAPAAPMVKSKTYNSVTLVEIPGAQYSMDDGTTWQDSPEFTGLSANTEYNFVARYGATESSFASPTSYKLKVTTNAVSSGGGSSTPTYPPTVTQSENGAVTVSPKTPKKGDTVTITPKPEAGYTVEQILVTDKNGDPVEVTNNGDGTYSFTQPAGKVNVKVTFMEDNSMLNFFVDVPADAYYYDAVLWAAKNGITGGVDDTHFAPNAPCTRAQIVTFLWRAAGCPEPETVSSFADVPADSYYAKAVAWAVENGITTGTGNGMFSPDATCTRAQAMTFIYRSEQAQGGGMQGAWMFQNPFADVNLESYYGEAVMWAVANGVTDGTTATTFSPNATCTRAQIVTFLYRFFVK